MFAHVFNEFFEFNKILMLPEPIPWYQVSTAMLKMWQYWGYNSSGTDEGSIYAHTCFSLTSNGKEEKPKHSWNVQFKHSLGLSGLLEKLIICATRPADILARAWDQENLRLPPPRIQEWFNINLEACGCSINLAVRLHKNCICLYQKWSNANMGSGVWRFENNPVSISI